MEEKEKERKIGVGIVLSCHTFTTHVFLRGLAQAHYMFSLLYTAVTKKYDLKKKKKNNNNNWQNLQKLLNW